MFFLEPLTSTVYLPLTIATDHRPKMSRPSDWPRVGCTQACDGRTNCLMLASDRYCRASRDADMILFQPQFFITMSVTFCKTDHSKKSHDIVTDQAMVAKTSWSIYWSHSPFWVSPLIIRTEYVMLIRNLFQFFYDSDILQHCSYLSWSYLAFHKKSEKVYKMHYKITLLEKKARYLKTNVANNLLFALVCNSFNPKTPQDMQNALQMFSFYLSQHLEVTFSLFNQ